MKINKWIPVVLAINLAMLGLAIYVLGLYQHRTSIVASQTPITDFSILEVNYRTHGSSVKIAYNVVFFFIMFLLSLLFWTYPEVRKGGKR